MRPEAERINQTLVEQVSALPESAREIACHILQAGGKRLRPLLVLLFAQLLGNEDERVYRLACAMEMLHAATLLHDDVLDNADKRRGKDAAHTVFDVCSAILGGDALLAQGNAVVASFHQPELVLCFSQATVKTAAGEILEMHSLRHPKLAMQEYIDIAKGKTACLIAQSCAMGAHFACADKEIVKKCEQYGENLGIAFQIVDDALDFAPQSQTGKPTGGDLREGKMTPPLILYRESLSGMQREAFDTSFSSGSFTDSELKEVCAACSHFINPALTLADKYLERARDALVSLPDRAQKNILDEMVEYVKSRKS